MLSTFSRALAVVALAASAIGGVAVGAAQAQSMPYQSQVAAFHNQVSVAPATSGHTAQPTTRDMGTSNATKAKPQANCDGFYYVDGWGVNLRSSPWGTIRAHANYGDNIYYLETQGDWSMINDYTANAWGVWIYNDYLGHYTPTCIQ